MKAGPCSSCKALVIWSVTKNNKPMPVDAKAVANGNIELEAAGDPRDPPTAHYLDKLGQREVDGKRRAPMLRYVSHFATCPNAAEHRKP